MIDEVDAKGLDHFPDSEDIYGNDVHTDTRFKQELKKTFEFLNVDMPNHIPEIIYMYVRPGLTYIHTKVDGGYVLINPKALGLSKLLSTLAHREEPISIGVLSEGIMSLVGQYLMHHMGKQPAKIAKPVRALLMHKNVKDPWDAKFVDTMTKRQLLSVIKAANYIGCPSLVHLGCLKVATLVKGKSPEEIKKILSEDQEVDDTRTKKRIRPKPAEIINDGRSRSTKRRRCGPEQND